MFGNVDAVLNAGWRILTALLIAFVTTSSADDAPACITCFRVNTTCYNATFLFHLEAPYRTQIVISKLGILRSTNTLFFNFQPAIADPEYSKIGFVSLDSPANASVITNKEYIMNFEAFDIDQDNGLVYLGGSDGIYVLDTKVNRVTPYSSRGDTVRALFYKGNVYFVRYNEFKIIRKKADNFDILVDEALVTNFVITKYNFIIFLCNFGLFVKRNKEMTQLSNNPFFRGLAIDLDDAVYTWWLDGIYRVLLDGDLPKSQLVKVADTPFIGALTFDNGNNIVFTSGKSLYRLVEANATLCS